MVESIVTAALVIIGDEILSGRTADKNINFLAKNLTELGIVLREVRVVADIEEDIILPLISCVKNIIIFSPVVA